jgi:DNA-binding response OmpR family regulator
MNSRPTSILVVDDQVDHLNAVELLLTGFGYRVTLCASGTDALTCLAKTPIDLILADVAMPHLNGYQLLEAVRRNTAWAHIPFVFLTARALDSDIRYGKTLGADDYLTKPIQPEDLLAVVEGKLRRHAQLTQVVGRANEHHPPDTTLCIGRLTIDIAHHRASIETTPLRLTVKEFSLLVALAEHAGAVLPATALVQITHGLQTSDADEARELVRPLVRTLRRKLGNAGSGPDTIETVRGLGYRLREA